MTKRDDSKRSGRGLASGGSSAQPALFDLATKQHGVVCRRQMTHCGLTVAEMDAALKNQYSHRARAMVQLQQLLRAVWRL